MVAFTILAEALHYPAPDSLEFFQSTRQYFPAGEAAKAFTAFIENIQKLSLGDWEELYTRTWDLDPIVVPYVGYQIWGEKIPRSNFLSLMNHALAIAGVDNCGELPDHLVPVLRYLEKDPFPLVELTDNLETALQKMLESLRKADRENPYILYLEAVLASWKASSIYQGRYAGLGKKQI